MPWLALVLVAAPLRWGADLQGGAPFAYQNPDNPSELLGFEVDIADALAKRLGRTAQHVQVDWSTLLQGLERDTYDIALNGLEATDARRALIHLSPPYLSFDLVLSGRPGTPVRTIGVLEGSQAAEWVRARPDKEARLYQGVEEPYLDLQAGRIDGVLMDSVIEAVYGKKPGTLVLDAHVASGTYVIGCKHDCASIDAALRAITEDGTLDRILRKWKLAGDEKLTAVDGHFRLAHAWLFAKAAAMTLLVSLLAMTLAAACGLTLATARAFGPRWLRPAASAWVEVFRGTPVLLQLYVIYFGLAPYLLLSPLTAAVITLGLNYGAYEAEIYRGGLNAVPERQWDAGLALGLGKRATFRHIILPQAVRIALPGMANDFVSLLKDSALVSVITVVELTKQMQITAVDVHSWLVPGAVCAAMYLALSLPASQLGRYLERRLA